MLTPTIPVRGARPFGDAVWLALSAALLAFVARFGVDLPYMDEWPTVDALANRTPLLSWLWVRHNEHILPVPRLLFWGLFQLAGDLRGGMFVSAVGWSVLARVLMSAARSARGHASYADIAFPLLLLHWGQYENVLMSYQVCFMLSTLLAGTTLALVVRPTPGPGRVLAVAGCTAALPLCGGHGLLFAGAGLIWLTAVAADRWVLPNGTTDRRTAFAAVAGLLGSLAAAAAYAVVPKAPPVYVPDISAWQFVTGWFGFETAGYGLAAERLWPWAAVAPAFVAVGVAACLWKSRRAVAGSDRLAYFGLAGAVAAGVLLAAAVAWGRARFGLHGVFFPRYVGLAALMPASAVLLWVKFGGPKLSRCGPIAVAITAALLLPWNLRLGWKAGEWLELIQSSATEELASGVPVEVVARKYHYLIYNNPDVAARFIENYADAGIGRFDKVTHEPPSAVVPLPTAPTRVRNARSLGEGSWASDGPDAALEYELPNPATVNAVVIRGRYRYPGFWPPAVATVEWWAEPGGKAVKTQTFPVFRFPTPDLHDPAIVVWVNGPIAGFRVAPDRGKWGFRPTSVEVLAPPGTATTNASSGTAPAPPNR